MPNKGKLLDHHGLTNAILRDHWLYELWHEFGTFQAECICPFRTKKYDHVRDALVELAAHMGEIFRLKSKASKIHTTVVTFTNDDGYYYALCNCGWLSEPQNNRGMAGEEKQYHLRTVPQYDT